MAGISSSTGTPPTWANIRRRPPRTRRGGGASSRPRCGLRRAVEPGVHAPDRVDAAAVCRVGVEHGAVLERERAQAGPLAGEAVRLGDRPEVVLLQRPLLGRGDAEVEVEVAAD